MSEPPLNLYDAAPAGNPDDPEGYRKRRLAFGAAIGGDRLGGSLYEIDPGNSLYPYHYEGVEEEWLLVLTGTPTLRDPEGEHELAPGDIVCFRPGPEGAHKVTNRSGAVTRIAMFSTVPKPDVSISVYPDSDKVGVWPWPGARLRLPDEPIGYWDGEV